VSEGCENGSVNFFFLGWGQVFRGRREVHMVRGGGHWDWDGRFGNMGKFWDEA
jgi:hypothetical protein